MNITSNKGFIIMKLTIECRVIIIEPYDIYFNL